jgi:hypothetical protein
MRNPRPLAASSTLVLFGLQSQITSTKAICWSVLLACLICASTNGILAANPNRNGKEAKDSVTVQADAIALVGVSRDKIKLEDKINWIQTFNDWKLDSVSTGLSCLKIDIDKNQAYVFHLVHWAGGGDRNPPRLISSAWSAYGRSSETTLKRRLNANGDPLIYGKKRVLLIGLNIFDDSKNGAGSLSIRYKSSVTQGKAENVQALGQLVSALAGLSTAKENAGSILVAISCLQGTDHLPFDLNVVETIGIPKPPDTQEQPKSDKPTARNSSVDSEPLTLIEPPQVDLKTKQVSYRISANKKGNVDRTLDQQQAAVASSDDAGAKKDNDSNKTDTQKTTPSGGQADCSSLLDKKDCTISRTLTSLDKEWWDVSLAVPTPGVKESRYSISGSTLQSKSTTHTDLYAMFDIYPWAHWVTKESGIPHFTVGLPVTGQTFYRPEFGISENVTGWTTLQRRGFPTTLNIFVGMAFMKTTIVQGAPTTAADLSTSSTKTRVWKPIFGIEVPVSSLVSKIGKSGQSKNTNGSKAGDSDGNKGTSAQ